MAIIPFTESDLQDQIHTLYENDPDTPASTEDDYLIRRRLMNVMVNRWENIMGTLWNELWTNTSVVSTGAVSYTHLDVYKRQRLRREPRSLQ